MTNDPFSDPAQPPRTGVLSLAQTGLAVGLVLGVVAAFGGFVPFLIVTLLGAIGLVVGLVLEGRLDLRGLVERGRR